MASPDRVVTTAMQVPATPSIREALSKTAMNFAPIYEKTKNNVFNQTMRSIESSLEKSSPVREVNTLPKIDLHSNFQSLRVGANTSLPSDRVRRNT